MNVLISLSEPRERWRRLGHGYRVQPSIVVWESNNAIQAPQSALFRDGERWAVFTVERDIARLRHVVVGQQNDMNVQVVTGLTPGERIVVHPNERIEEGTRLAVRAGA